jgi:hypothetical protein
MEGKIDSWDTVWGYTLCKHDAVALLPVSSKAYNIGLDGSGTHCKRAPFKQHVLAPGTGFEYRFPDSVDVEPYFVAEIQRLHRPSMVRRLARFIQRFEPGTRRLDAATARRGRR